jgi:hypothetical protein
MVVAAWQCSTVAIDYGKMTSRERQHLTVAVAGGNGDWWQHLMVAMDNSSGSGNDGKDASEMLAMPPV